MNELSRADGWLQDVVGRAAALDALSGGEALQWPQTLRRLVASADRSPATGFLRTEVPLPFEELLAAPVAQASDDLRAQAPSGRLADSALTALQRDLLRRLCRLSARALQHEFALQRTTRGSFSSGLLRFQPAGSRDLYLAFVHDVRATRFEAIFREYPLLARAMALAIEHWRDAAAEMLRRLDDDVREIETTFLDGAAAGAVVALRPSLSDPHHGGRTAAALDFESGLRVFYKPRSLEPERALFAFLSWSHERGAPVSSRQVRILPRPEYGWMEAVQPRACADVDDVRLFYIRAGGLLAVAYALGMTDLHQHNILADGAHPIVVDAETLLHPREKVERDGRRDAAGYAAARRLRDSVLNTGLLPSWSLAPDGDVFDASGLGAHDGAKTSFLDAIWHAINQDGMYYEYELVRVPAAANRPAVDGQKTIADRYRPEIVDGFRRTYRVLAQHRRQIVAPDGPLAPLASLSSRYVFRATRAYFHVLADLGRPDRLRDAGIARDRVDMLGETLSDRGAPGPFSPLLEAERAALFQGDIPRFSVPVRGEEIRTGSWSCAPGALEPDAFGAARARIEALSDDDLEQQCALVESSFAGRADDTESRRPSRPKGSLSDDESVAEATTIGREIARRAVRASRRVAWLGFATDYAAARLRPDVVDDGLYEGRAGIAVFLAALARSTGQADFRALAEEAIAPLRGPHGSGREIVRSLDLGIASGVGGRLYALVTVSHLLSDDEMLLDAVRTASHLERERIDAEEEVDVIRGVAGLALGLAALNARAPSAALRRTMDDCARKLLASRTASERGHLAWTGRRERALTGFSHGAAGIAYALLRLRAADPTWRDAVRGAHAYEAEHFSAPDGNWADLRRPEVSTGRPACGNSWCHGAPGIALERMAWLAEYPDDAAAKLDVNAALATIRASRFDVDSLCCGAAGVVEILSHVREDSEAPRRLASEIVLRARAESGYRPASADRRVFHPGLFQGIAGVGYQLLRIADPRLPALLSFGE